MSVNTPRPVSPTIPSTPSFMAGALEKTFEGDNEDFFAVSPSPRVITVQPSPAWRQDMADLPSPLPTYVPPQSKKAPGRFTWSEHHVYSSFDRAERSLSRLSETRKKLVDERANPTQKANPNRMTREQDLMIDERHHLLNATSFDVFLKPRENLPVNKLRQRVLDKMQNAEMERSRNEKWMAGNRSMSPQQYSSLYQLPDEDFYDVLNDVGGEERERLLFKRREWLKKVGFTPIDSADKGDRKANQ